MQTVDMLSFGMTSSSFLVASATFLMGFYLSERARGTPSDRLGMFKLAILSLVIPSVTIIISMILMLVCAKDPQWVFFSFILILSLSPSVVILAILFKLWD